MCDRCGTVFSERAEGWSTFAGSRRMKNQDTGKMEQVSEQMDSCPDCSEMMLTPQRPELTTTVSSPREPTVSPHYEPGT